MVRVQQPEDGRSATFDRTPLGTQTAFTRLVGFRTSITFTELVSITRLVTFRSSITFAGFVTFTRLVGIRASITFTRLVSITRLVSFTTPIRFTGFVCFRASITFTRREVLDKFFLGQRRIALLAGPAKRPFHQGTDTFGNFVNGQLAIAVGVQPSKHFFRIAQRLTRTPAARFTHFLDELLEVFPRDFVLADAFEHRGQTLAQFGGQLFLRQFAVGIGIELLEQLARFRSGTVTTTTTRQATEIFQSQLLLAGAIEERLHALAELFGNFVERELAVLVAIEHFKPLARVLPALLAASSAQWNIRTFFGLVGLLEFLAGQRAIGILVAAPHETFEETSLPFGNLVGRQFAVAVLVQSLKQRARIRRRFLPL